MWRSVGNDGRHLQTSLCARPCLFCYLGCLENLSFRDTPHVAHMFTTLSCSSLLLVLFIGVSRKPKFSRHLTCCTHVDNTVVLIALACFVYRHPHMLHACCKHCRAHRAGLLCLGGCLEDLSFRDTPKYCTHVANNVVLMALACFADRNKP